MHRVRFFHEHGLVPVMPTKEQIQVGFFVPRRLHRLFYFGLVRLTRRIKSMTLTKPEARGGKALYLANTIGEGEGQEEDAARETFESLGIVGKLVSVPLVRGLVLGVLCPEYLLAGFGMTCGRNLITNHLLYLPHIGIGPTWDLQLLQGDPGGLDWLEERLELARERDGFRGKLYYNVARSGGDVDAWYTTLGTIVADARRFEYHAMPGTEITFVQHLNLCARLEPSELSWFRAHPETSIRVAQQEIGWEPMAILGRG